MFLIKLITKNFKKLGDAEFNFTDGLNVIVGDNAAGKSTLLRAVKASLFGVATIPGKKDNIPTWGQTTFGLELHFEVEGKVYELTRTKSTAKLVKAGASNTAERSELVANGNTPVTAYIENLLGLTAKDYDLFIQSAQGETSGILTFGGAALSRKVEEFAGIDTIDKVQSAANQEARDQGSVAAANEVSKEELDGLNLSIDQASAELVELTNHLAETEEKLKTLKDVVLPGLPSPSSDELSRVRRAADRHAMQRKELTLAVEHCRERLEALEPVVEPAADLELTLQLDGVTSRRTAARLNKKQLDDALGIKRNLQDWEKDYQTKIDAHAPVTFDAERLEAVNNSIKSLEDNLAPLKLQLTQLKSMSEDALCPTCGTQLTEHSPDDLVAEIEELEVRITDNTAHLNAFLKQRSTLLKEEKAYDKAIQKLESYQAELQEVQSKLADLVIDGCPDQLQHEIEELDEALARLNHEKEQLDVQLAAYQKYQRDKKRLLSSLKEAEQALADHADFESDIDVSELDDTKIDAVAQLEAEIHELKRENTAAVASAQRAVFEAEAAVERKQTLLETKERDREQLLSRACVASDAAEATDVAKRLSRFLGDRRASYLADVWDSVLATASKQVRTSTDGEISSVFYRDGDFFYIEDGIEIPTTEASGAQKAHIGVALRIGLSRVLYGSDALLILDEPTESMREEKAVNLVASLAGSAKQTLLITHREQDQALANNVISIGE